MNKNLLPIHFAPLQGYTDAAYRQAHACIFGGIDTYYSPFVRVEHGEIRRKDIRDINPENNRNIHLIPQLIAPQPSTLEQIVSLFIEHNYQEADINLGRPFPMLAKRHNGAGNVAVSRRNKRTTDCRHRKISSNPFLSKAHIKGLGKRQ